MPTVRGVTLALIALVVPTATCIAQTYLQYHCEDGAQLSVAFVEQSNAAYVHLDGKAVILPRRLSGSGARYAKGGVTLWIKGNETQLKRPKRKRTHCKTA